MGETHGRQVNGAEDADRRWMSQRFLFQILHRELTFTYTRSVEHAVAERGKPVHNDHISDAMGLAVLFTMTRNAQAVSAPAMAAIPASPVVHRTGP